MDSRFEASSITAEIFSILQVSRNCIETFKDIKLPDYIGNGKLLPLENIKKLRVLPSGEEIFLETNPFSPPNNPQKSFHLSAPYFKVRSYDTWSSYQETPAIDVYFHLPFIWEEQTTLKKIPLSLVFNESGELSHCSVQGNTEKGGLLIIDPTKEDVKKESTGDEACSAKGKTCVAVTSQNYATRVYGQFGLDNLCHSNYNTGLVGVKQGVYLSSWHDCSAKLGSHETYTLDKEGLQLTCLGIFVALCQ